MYEKRYHHVAVQVSDSGVSIGTVTLTEHEAAVWRALCERIKWDYEKGESGAFLINEESFESREEAKDYAKCRFENLYDR